MKLKSLHYLKKAPLETSPQKFYDILIIGEDAFALSALKSLWERFGADKVAFIAPRQLAQEDFALRGPCSLRGELNEKIFKEMFPSIPLSKERETSSFYKDSKFRSFKGRAKSETLLSGEKFYIDGRPKFDKGKLFGWREDNAFKAKLQEKAYILLVTDIKKVPNTAPAGEGRWQVACSNGQKFLCNHLVFGRSPAGFLNMYNDKGDFSHGLIESCEKTHTPCSLIVRFEFNKLVCEREESLFLPLSFTHEWGHFVGEFSPFEESVGQQTGEFIHFIDKNDATEDEISKKIRLLKKNLEKNFPMIKESIFQEFIFLQEESAGLIFDDFTFLTFEKESIGAYFIGENAYLGKNILQGNSFVDEANGPSHLVRGLLSLRALEGLSL